MSRLRKSLCLGLILVGTFYFGNYSYASEINSSVTGTSKSVKNFGRESPNDSEIGFKWVAPNSNFLCSVTVHLSKNSAVTDGLIMSVYRNGTDTYKSGTLWGSSQTIPASYLENGANAGTEVTVNFNPCISVQGGDKTWIIINRDGEPTAGSDYYYISGILLSNSPTYFPNSNIYMRWTGITNGETGTPMAVYASMSSTPDFTIPTFSPTASDSWFNLSGAESFCNNQFPPATGASASWYNFNITNNLCLGIGFLFIPNTSALTQSYASISSETDSRIPFSYMKQFSVLLLDSTSASHSTRFNPALNLNLNYLGVHSSVSFSPLSSASVNYYAPGWLTTFRTIMDYVLYAGFAWLMYNKARHKLK